MQNAKYKGFRGSVWLSNILPVNHYRPWLLDDLMDKCAKAERHVPLHNFLISLATRTQLKLIFIVIVVVN